MREIWILGSYPPPYGGVATFVRNLHDNLFRDGIRHHMIIRSDRNHRGMQLLEMDVLPYFFQMCGIKRKSCVIDSCNIFLEYPADAKNKKKFVIWNFLVKRKKVTWIKIFHDGTLPYRYRNWGHLDRFVLRHSLKNMKKILTVEDSIGEWLVKEVGYKGEVKTIKSILPRKYKSCPLPSNVRTFIQKYKYVIVSVGTCKKEYGFQDIIAALKLLPQEYQNDTGVILIDGNFAAKDRSYMNVRKQFTGISNVLLLSKVDNDMVYSIMKSSMVFIRGVSFESYGISRVEAILAGVPVIATNVGETRGMYTYEYGDIERLSQLIQQAMRKELKTDLKWIRFYEKEAEANYRLIKKEVLGN